MSLNRSRNNRVAQGKCGSYYTLFYHFAASTVRLARNLAVYGGFAGPGWIDHAVVDNTNECRFRRTRPEGPTSNTEEARLCGFRRGVCLDV